MKATIVTFAVCMTLAMGCAALQSSPVIGPASDLAVCVLSHDTEPPQQIAEKCAANAIEDVLKIIAAERAAEARHAGAGRCPQDAGADQ